jgi:hypothetical protein
MDKRKANDLLLCLKKEPVMLEITTTCKKYLEKYAEAVRKQKKPPVPKMESGFRVYGKYRVKETFAGEESLTTLLTQYIERTVALNY